MTQIDTIAKHNLTYVILFLLLASYFWPISQHRLIDEDEGYYLLASRLVLEHKLPYLDFFYGQAPLLPFAYAGWMKIVGVSWFSARSFSAILTAVLGLLIYDHVRRETGNLLAAVAAIILFASSTPIITWFLAAKTFSLSTLFLFASYAIVARLASKELPRSLLIVAGILFGLSVDARSYLVVLLPVFLWWTYYHSKARGAGGSILSFLGGFIVGLAPSLILFAAAPDVFLFDNLGAHALNEDSAIIADWKQKLETLSYVMFGRRANGLQFTSLSVISVIVILMTRKYASVPVLAFLIALIIAVVSLLPSPTFTQYYSACMPFLIAAAICGIAEYLGSLDARPPRRLVALACIGALVILVASAPPTARWAFFGGAGVYTVEDAPNWSLGGVTAVSDAIRELAAPNEKVISFWPGYLLASKPEPYPGFENDFSWLLTSKLTPAQRARYKIGAPSDIDAAFSAHTPSIVVVGNNEYARMHSDSEYLKALQANGYTVAQTIGATSIFKYSPPNP